MVWDDSYYLKHEQAETYLKQILGLTQLDYWKERQVLIPYFYYIINYLDQQLTDLGTEDIKELVEEVFRIFEWGGDLIIDHKACLLAYKIGCINLNELGIGPSDPEKYSDDLLPKDWASIEIDGESEIAFNRTYFVFCWSNLMSTLCLRLKFQYGYLFAQEPDGECCVCGARGQTETDYESWESGVYPEDECYDRSNYFRSNTAWGLEKDRFCECYKHPTD